MRRVPQGGKVEDVGRQHETSLRRTAEVEPETGKQFTQAMAELEERRRAAVNAEDDEVGRREYALLRELEAFEEG